MKRTFNSYILMFSSICALCVSIGIGSSNIVNAENLSSYMLDKENNDEKYRYETFTEIHEDSEGNEYEMYFNNGSLTFTNIKSASKYVKEIVIPEGVCGISAEGINYARCGSIYIPKTVRSITNMAFNCAAEFIVDEANTDYISIDGVVYTKNMKKMVAYPSYKKDKVYIMPDTVEEADVEWGPENLENLRYIIFSSSIKCLDYVAPNTKGIYIKTDNLENIDDIKTNGLRYETPENCNEKLVIYLDTDSPYRDVFKDNSKYILVTDDNYDMSHVIEALKMSLGINETQLDLRKYKDGKEKLLFDIDSDNRVTLADTVKILKSALIIKK